MFFKSAKHPAVEAANSKLPDLTAYQNYDYIVDSRSCFDEHLKSTFDRPTRDLRTASTLCKILSGQPRACISERLNAAGEELVNSAASRIAVELYAGLISIVDNQLGVLLRKVDRSEPDEAFALWPSLPFELYFLLPGDGKAKGVSGRELKAPAGVYHARLRMWDNLLGNGKNVLIDGGSNGLEFETDQAGLLELLSARGVVLAINMQNMPRTLLTEGSFDQTVFAELQASFDSPIETRPAGPVPMSTKLGPMLNKLSTGIQPRFGALAGDFATLKYCNRSAMFPLKNETTRVLISLGREGYLTQEHLEQFKEDLFW